MSKNENFDRIAGAWMAEGPDQLADRVLDAALTEVHLTRQRRGSFAPRRFFHMSTYSRTAAAAGLIVLVVGGGLLLLRPNSSGVGGPYITASPSPIAPSPSLIPTAAATTGPIAFVSKNFAVPLSLTIMDGWSFAVDAAEQVELLHGDTDSDLAIMAMASVTVPGATAADPYVPFPADITAWLATRPEFLTFAPREVTVGGRKGTLVEVDFVAAPSAKYTIIDYGSGGWTYGGAATAGQHGRFIVLPGPGNTGVVIFMESPKVGFEATAASLDRVLATLIFR